ncbi:phytanoyl-CoA dioxygenase family protein [Oceanospirillaceae bacterium]|nr:phytanoyl-CoA dioxygenase family protein [Oceanospirillaceae bacterium]MDB9752617.1 phytanoyl-CoA dioxygenase family protein [Oceanospirillaceae bacterium]MDC1340489.1 phytanoyl-CoA dioxygenase family protein [Oceanospirillaceae bacterium]
MGKVLSQQQISAYHEQGFISPIDVMSEDEATSYAHRLKAAEEKYPNELSGVNRNNGHLCFTFLDELAYHPKVLDAVEDILGAHFSLWGSVLFIKEPNSSHFVSWHQDATYMGITPRHFVTPWIALTHSDRHTGCMSMIPKSHLNDIQPHKDTYGEDNILTRGQEVANVAVDQAVDLILKPGQMSLHHAMTIHGSQPNQSQHQRRIGFALQSFMPAGATQTIGQNNWSPARGHCAQDGYHYLPRPQIDMASESVMTRDKCNQNFSDILYHGAKSKRDY